MVGVVDLHELNTNCVGCRAVGMNRLHILVRILSKMCQIGPKYQLCVAVLSGFSIGIAFAI
jgi:hypothetical protein